MTAAPDAGTRPVRAPAGVKTVPVQPRRGCRAVTSAARTVGRDCWQRTNLPPSGQFVRRYGTEELLDCLERNEQAGVVYHRQGVTGDYDGFSGEEGLIAFIKTGRKDDGEKK